MTVDDYKAHLAAAKAPRELGAVPRHEPRRTRTSSNRRRRPAMAKGRGAGGRAVTHRNRRVRIAEGVGVDEIHPGRVDPFEEGGNLRGPAYRNAHERRPMAAINGFYNKKLREALARVVELRASLGDRRGLTEIDAELYALSQRPSLRLHEAEAILSIKNRLYDIIDSNTEE